MSATPRTDALQPYLNRGFVEICTDSGIGSRILVNETSDRVVKLNEDRAYHTFAEHAKSTNCEHLPRIFSHSIHEQVDQFQGYWFTVTEMEKLQPLSQSEADAITAWYAELVGSTSASPSALDPFELLPTYQNLKDVAVNAGHNLDMGKPANYMVREHDGKRTIVFTDPYN